MKKLKQIYKIQAPVEKVWHALIDSKIINEWGGGPSKMSDNVGDTFSLWGGDIYGKNTNIKKFALLEQDWQQKEWNEPTRVLFTLAFKNNITTVTLVHSNIPDDEYKDIKQGWKDFYMEPLKQLVETNNK